LAFRIEALFSGIALKKRQAVIALALLYWRLLCLNAIYSGFHISGGQGALP
jgi:hypothetical protein